MNLEETGDLLLLAKVFDNRKFDDFTVLAWQSVLHDVEAGDAMEAARLHYATSEDYLMPVHIRDGARDLKVARQRGRELRAINAPRLARTDPAGHTEYQAFRSTIPQRDPDEVLRRVNPTAWRWKRSQRQYTGPHARPVFSALPPHLQEEAS